MISRRPIRSHIGDTASLRPPAAHAKYLQCRGLTFAPDDDALDQVADAQCDDDRWGSQEEGTDAAAGVR